MTIRALLLALCTAIPAVGGCSTDRNASRSNNAPPKDSSNVNLGGSPWSPGSFAYVDSTGTEVLALTPIRDQSAIRGALCANGTSFQVRYARTQEEQEGNTHRQTSSNFSREKGDVFRLLSGTAAPDETCFLTPDAVLLREAGRVERLSATACDQQQTDILVRIGDRDLVHCWRLAKISWGAQLLAAQFVTTDTNALAALALFQDSILLFYGIPAAYHGPDEDIWRVDDQGVFSPEAFTLLFAARSTTGYALALAWAGSEGESDKLLIADSTHVAREILTDYRYWVPD